MAFNNVPAFWVRKLEKNREKMGKERVKSGRKKNSETDLNWVIIRPAPTTTRYSAARLGLL